MSVSMAPSSPRLPSPPPPAENQLGPKSPLMGPNATRQGSNIEQTAIDANAKRRIHKGTKAADMAAGPPLVPLQELDSAFQLQEHLAALHYYHTASGTQPITRDTAKILATPPSGIDKTLWLYELCRFLIAQCNDLIIGFLFDTPPCSAATCPEMRASEWQFLCAVHDQPKSCCAIDYCCHTLDWAANVVTNPKIFPSRFVVDSHDKNTAVKNLVNVFRRLHRIFAHAWFQHRGVFWAVENQYGLYVLFKRVCDGYELLPAENYKLPPEAEGLETTTLDSGLSDQRHPSATAQITIAKPPQEESVGRTNTRRHIKSSPSTGSFITSVPEADEDDTTASHDITTRLGELHLANVAPPGLADDELELASIPVIVEHGPPINAEMLMRRPSSVIPPPAVAASIAAEELRLQQQPRPVSPPRELHAMSIEPELEEDEVSEAETEVPHQDEAEDDEQEDATALEEAEPPKVEDTPSDLVVETIAPAAESENSSSLENDQEEPDPPSAAKEATVTERAPDPKDDEEKAKEARRPDETGKKSEEVQDDAKHKEENKKDGK
ncbi:mob1 family protein [Podospora fimiseda]|uniref:Mob1 family protein n=1 Tax=Podospora fimiseda TaxID=252190 RepID=A0AAN7BXH5_9PEZI|nr:mob1 family protein [Podospora fimiseda]